MKSHRTLTALGLSLALAGIGCQSETTAEDEPSVAEQALEEGAPAPDANEPAARHHGRKGHHARKGHHGPDKLLRAALKELDLSAEQRATIEESLEGLEESFRKGFDRGEHAERSKALADAVRAGSVDAAALSGSDDFEAKMKEGRASLVEALDQLHATLTPEQRAQLVETLQSRMKDHDPEKKRAWKDKMAKKGPSHFMLRGLDVSEEQRAKIDAALAAEGLDQPPEGMHAGFAAMKEQRAAMLEAFASDSFDAAALLPAKGPDFAAGKRRFVESLAVIVPLLDESQRAELAERIERGPMFDRKRKQGKRGPRGDRKGAHRRGDAAPADQL